MKSCQANKYVKKAYDGKCTPREKKKKSTKYVVIVVVLILVLVIVIGIVAYWIYSKRNRQSKDLKKDESSGDNLL